VKRVLVKRWSGQKRKEKEKWKRGKVTAIHVTVRGKSGKSVLGDRLSGARALRMRLPDIYVCL